MPSTAAAVPELQGNHIAGMWRAPTGPVAREIREPANRDRVLWLGRESSPEDASAAIAAAGQAFLSWRRVAPQERGEILRAAAAWLRDSASAVADDIALEEGKTRAEARLEVRAATASLDYFAGQTGEPIGDVLPPSRTAELIWSERVPLGPVICITPWNFPVLIPTYKIAAALAIGNTVVFKPASLTPRSATHLVEALVHGGVPAGVVNLVLGSGASLVDALLTHPEVRGVSFTGSNPVGREIARRLLGTSVRVQLEMGGKNPLIVLDDADVEKAARDAVDGAMGMAGERCTATSRVIVEGPRRHRAFVEAVVGLVERIKVGHPLDPGVDMGPLISDDQRRKVVKALRRARSSGAQLLVGGDIPRGSGFDAGNFLNPTVYRAVPPGSELAQEELFGPVMAIIEAATAEEAIAIANGTRYGLAASVHTRDLGRAVSLTRELEFGVVHVNRPTPSVERYAPFGGVKASGFGGREQGRAAREFFSEWKTVYVSAPAGATSR